ncbi:MAG: amidohydrolase family protein, partial [Polyangiaceae bacterium]|nr:amidohydrolase family protein [Polyangiaceae bacterium]
REGLTSVGVVPTGGLVSGQSAWADLDGNEAARALAVPSLALHVLIDDATHETVRESHASSLLRLRELLDDARLYRQKRQGYEDNRLRTLGTSRLDLETLVRALEGTLPVVFHVDRASDILAVLALAAEYRLVPVVASAAEGWKVAPALAAAKVPVIVYPLDHGPRSFAARGAREDNAALLTAAGVAVSLSTGESHNARKLRQEAGNAVRAGLSRRAALAAVTSQPARAFGLGERYGSLAPGHVGNAVVWSADPFELSTQALAVVVRGKLTSLRTRQTALFLRYRP